MIEVKATYLRENVRFEQADGYVIVGDCQLVDGPDVALVALAESLGDSFDGFALKGPLDTDELKPGSTYLFYGSRWAEYRNQRTGRASIQFAFKTYVETQPYSRQGVVSYLRKCEGVGLGIADALWKKFNSKAVEILRTQPEVAAAAVPRLSIEVAEQAARQLAARWELESCTIGLMGLLDSRNFPKATAKRAIEKWGNRAKQVIEKFPYALMEFRGCGFKKCDNLFLELGNNPNSRKRQAICAAYYLENKIGGDTWCRAERVVAEITQNIGATEANPIRALQLARRAGLIEVRRVNAQGNFTEDREGSTTWLASGRKARQEKALADYIIEAEQENFPLKWPEASELPALSPHKQEQTEKALSGRIAILTGLPGTGKTYTAASVARYLVEHHGASAIAACALAGKAADRLTEAMAEYRIPIRATTIHSLLGMGEGGKFKYGRDLRLPHDFLITDEASMDDVPLFCALLAARKPGAHILILGDDGQLLPIGHGAPLRDLMEVMFNVGKLTEIRRNSGAIVQACKDMAETGRFQFSRPANMQENNLHLVVATTPEAQIEKLLRALDVFKLQGFDPVWDCQTVAAVNKKGPLSRKELNRILQAHLNPGPVTPGCPFRLNDKVVNTRGEQFTLVDNQEPMQPGDEPQKTLKVANGTVGRVVESDPKFFIVKLASGTTIRVPRGKIEAEKEETDAEAGEDDRDRPATGCSWDLAYALSVHKAQGSEWPIVLVMLDTHPSARRLACREWFNTAISRARKFCVAIGVEETAQRMAAKPTIHLRKTFLKELLVGELIPF